MSDEFPIDAEDLMRFESICSEFEANWTPVGVANIQLAVEKAPDLQAAIVPELVSLDCELLASVRQLPSPERYNCLPNEYTSLIKLGIKLWQQTRDTVEESAEFPQGLELEGGYQIRHVIGRGGMGVVYKAIRQPHARCVGIKSLANANVLALRERFNREARAIARLNHPNIVEMHGSGSHQGTPFFAMQLVSGGSLKSLISEARHLTETTPPETAHLTSAERPHHPLLGSNSYAFIARLGIDIARALAYAHGQGIIHQDVKPGNILLDDDCNPFLSDFGLARFTDEASDPITTHSALGSLRYAAPEQIEGKSDARSDIYSLGITLYELMTLRPAYPEKEYKEILNAMSRPPAPPTSIDSSIPNDLGAIIEKAIERDMRNRYQTAEDLAVDLEIFLNGTSNS